MKRTLGLICLFFAISATAGGLMPDKVATITADHVNLRQSPSATSKPLGWISTGSVEEESCYIPELKWKPDLIRKGKFVNTQVDKGDVFPMIAQDGDWIQIEYQRFQPWIMSKFAQIGTPGELYPGISFSNDLDWCNANLGILPDGSSIYYEEYDTIVDGGIYFGTLMEGKVVIDRYVDGTFEENTDIEEEIEVIKNDVGGLNIKWGKDLRNPSHQGFLTLDLNKLTKEMYDYISQFGEKMENPFILYLTPGGGLNKLE